MAADPSLDWVSSLPWRWSYGITQSGRVFFINEEAKSTTWLHPVTGEAVVTGHRKTPDLPTGWEEGYTFEGARYYIKGLQQIVEHKSTFHPFFHLLFNGTELSRPYLPVCLFGYIIIE
ncbi:pleckstrin homology domain-containing family A member 5 isoform X20 [Ascaphus truei]|uniref:pleckstrin homology domain-containing family A member 5 isoform X20 n=1 Tax=Ascaphus truei TaxID=8439 RepID=UPI003F59926C